MCAQTVNWERDSKRGGAYSPTWRGSWGWGFGWWSSPPTRSNPWRLPLIAVFDNQQIGVITRRAQSRQYQHSV
ncbi:hypothetical protein O5707_07405 [Escherichia coli]|nr:hypothetical protein [Escherichia coli]